MERNEPLLADVRAPWDVTGWGARELLKPKNLWRTIAYSLKHRGFWAPVSMNPWRYRRFLGDLDDVCLRGLKSQGALTARELAEWLNRENLLRMKPERTGIHQMTAATAHAWFDFADRRGLVSLWTPVSRFASGSVHWELTEKGREAMRSQLLIRIERLVRLLPAVVASGLLLAVLDWLAGHPGAVVWAFLASVVVLEIVAVNFFMGRSEKRAAPGVAVVAIETLRSANKPIPRL